MNDALLNELHDPRVMAALTLGTARAAIDAPASLGVPLDSGGPGTAERWPLIAAAILGQERSFRRTVPPKFQEGTRLPESNGPWLTESERSILRRLVNVRKDYGGILAALWAGLQASPRRLHPFDLPALRPLLTGPAAVPGPVESAWLVMTSAAGASEVTAGGAWTDESWLEATPAAQGEYAAGRRRQDPAAGRALIQRGLEGQPAATRCRLVEALATGLSHADRELLESLLADRAKSVKEAAMDLLAWIPGTAAYAELLQDALEQLDVGKKGLLGRKKSLKLRRGGARPRQVLFRAQAVFQRIRSQDLATALNVSVEDMFRAATKDAILQSVFLGRAMAEGVEATSLAAPLLPEADGWDVLSTGSIDNDSPELRRTLPLVLHPSRWSSWPSSTELDELQAILGGPLSEEAARELLGGAPLKDVLKEEAGSSSPDGARFLVLVGLIPPSLHALLKERLAALPFHCTSVALELIQFTASLLAPTPTDD